MILLFNKAISHFDSDIQWLNIIVGVLLLLRSFIMPFPTFSYWLLEGLKLNVEGSSKELVFV